MVLNVILPVPAAFLVPVTIPPLIIPSSPRAVSKLEIWKDKVVLPSLDASTLLGLLPILSVLMALLPIVKLPDFVPS